MQFTHSTKDGLPCIFIRIYSQRRIFFNQFCNGHTHFINVSLRFRFDCHRNNRFRDEHILQGDRVVLVTKCIPCFDLFETNSCTDIASLDEIDWVLLIGKHFHNTADPFFLATSYV